MVTRRENYAYVTRVNVEIGDDRKTREINLQRRPKTNAVHGTLKASSNRARHSDKIVKYINTSEKEGKCKVVSEKDATPPQISKSSLILQEKRRKGKRAWGLLQYLSQLKVKLIFLSSIRSKITESFKASVLQIIGYIPGEFASSLNITPPILF
jgi:hypothetical protein